MRTEVKKTMKLMVGFLALAMSAGCILSEVSRNEVIRSFQYEGHGVSVTCIEQASVSTNKGLKVRDVYVRADRCLQSYRIKGTKVMNYRWSNSLENPRDSVTQDACDTFFHKRGLMREVIEKLPNRVERNYILPQPSERNPVVTVTEMGCYEIPPPPPTWNCWTARQWAGESSEVPQEIDAFRQVIEQVLSVPKCAKNHPSYLRAVPLLTKAALDAEQKTPVVKWESMRYPARFALQYPYLLIPMSGRRTPFFPITGTYKPGDKFKVQCYYDNERYFLIETFSGGKEK